MKDCMLWGDTNGKNPESKLKLEGSDTKIGDYRGMEVHEREVRMMEMNRHN